MKKRQVMALILAAALALPNTGVVADIVGVPIVVEASSGAQIDFSSVTPTGSQKVSAVEVSLTTTAAAAKVKKTETATTVGDVIRVGSGWKVLNGSDALKRGNDNVAKLRYTFAKEASVTGNGWEKDGDVYYAEFDIKFEAVEAIDAATVIEACKWPELTDKTYDAAKSTQKDYWNDDLKSGSSAYGTFSVVTDAVSGAGSEDVDVTFTLNPGYEFAANDTIDGVSVTAGGTTYVKAYKLNVNKQVISQIEWPEVKAADGKEIVYDAQANEVLDLTFAESKDTLINFTLVDKSTKNAVLDTVKLKNGVNDFLIKAEAADGANYAIDEKNQYKEVSVNVSAPSMKKVELKKVGDKGDEAITGDLNGGTDADASVELKAIDTWSPAFADESARDALYTMNYQWYKDGAKIEGAAGTQSSYTVEKTASGEYYCKVSATFKKSASVENSEIYKDQPALDTQKVNVAFSAIAAGSIADKGTYGAGTYDNANPAKYGGLTSDVVYTVPVTGLSSKAEMTLAVKDADGNDVTSAVSSMISGKAGAIASNGTCNYVITVNKNTDAGTYTFAVKVKDGNNTVTLADAAKLKCVIGKQQVAIAQAQIKPVNKEFVHGDKFDKLTGFEYVPVANATTDQKRAAKEINDKINVAVKDWANSGKGFSNGYFEKKDGKVIVNVELKNDYKKNYELGTITTTQSYLGTAEVDIAVAAKKITLGVENLEMVKGESLPKRTITGADFLEADNVTVSETGWKLYEKDDKTQTQITNAVKSLKPGHYIVSVDIAVNGAKSTNYLINEVAGTGATNSSDTRDVRAELTIYESQHTVGFVSYGDANVPDVKVYHGEAIGTLPTPVRAGYKFVGWYSDRNLTTAYDAKSPVTADVTLYAKWEKTSAGSTGGQDSADAVKVGTTTKTSAGTFAVINATTRTVSYKAASKSAKKVTIPSSVTIKGVAYKVTKIDNNAFKNCKKLTKVTIPSTVTEIGTAAFKGCKKLTSITIPKNVNKIGKEAFSGCKKLKKVTIKSTLVKSVGKNAFKGIAKKSVIKTPKAKKAAYKKILKKSGYKKTVK